MSVMKPIRLFWVTLLLLSSMAATAQNDSLIPFHFTGFDGNQQESIMLQRDGSIVTSTCVSLHEGWSVHYVGDIFHKISTTGLCITDTLFVPDSVWPPFYLLARNPLGSDNLRVSIRPEDNDSSYLHIAHFADDDLAGNPSDETVVPLCEGRAWDYFDNYMIDSNGDLIVLYYTGLSQDETIYHIARYGLDGTLKHEAILPSLLYRMPHVAEYSSSPLQYYAWKVDDDQNLAFYLLDEDFQVCDSFVVDKEYNPHVERFAFREINTTNHDYVIPDEEDLVIATTYKRDSLIPVYNSQGIIVDYALNSPDSVEYGAAVARIGLQTGEIKKLHRFNELPGPQTVSRHMGFHKTSDGGYLYVFDEYAGVDNIPDGNWLIVAVRFDAELNVVWKRYCNPYNLSHARFYWGMLSTMFGDGDETTQGMAIAGTCVDIKDINRGGLFYLLVYDDGTMDVNGSSIEVRPYAFYPNPVEGMLRFDFSPDVKPSSVEFFDLQGRLVLTQCDGLRSVDTGRLASGTYVMRVALKDGRTFSDKLVKE